MRKRKRLQVVIAGCFSTFAVASSASAPANGLRPIEETMAYELLHLEMALRDVSLAAETVLRSALHDATAEAQRLTAGGLPSTEEEALAVLEAVHSALVKQNFIQPPNPQDWPQTLGLSLVARSFSAEQVDALLDDPQNTHRRPYIDRARPIYYVDCDMGALLLISVGERLGWDVRLVEIPNHNFIRWYISDNLIVPWDWSWGNSLSNLIYESGISGYSKDPRLRRQYLRSFAPEEAKAYYKGLIGSEATDPEAGERLLREALEVLPHHPLTLNNFAWLYATGDFLGDRHTDLAVAYALSAWSMRIEYGNFIDTAACALAAHGETEAAVQLQELAIRKAESRGQVEAFRKNLRRIRSGKLCSP